MKKDPDMNIIFSAIALAMGVAGIVLSILGKFSEQMIILYGIAIFCLALDNINKIK